MAATAKPTGFLSRLLIFMLVLFGVASIISVYVFNPSIPGWSYATNQHVSMNMTYGLNLLADTYFTLFGFVGRAFPFVFTLLHLVFLFQRTKTGFNWISWLSFMLGLIVMFFGIGIIYYTLTGPDVRLFNIYNVGGFPAELVSYIIPSYGLKYVVGVVLVILGASTAYFSMLSRTIKGYIDYLSGKDLSALDLEQYDRSVTNSAIVSEAIQLQRERMSRGQADSLKVYFLPARDSSQIWKSMQVEYHHMRDLVLSYRKQGDALTPAQRQSQMIIERMFEQKQADYEELYQGLASQSMWFSFKHFLRKRFGKKIKPNPYKINIQPQVPSAFDTNLSMDQMGGFGAANDLAVLDQDLTPATATNDLDNQFNFSTAPTTAVNDLDNLSLDSFVMPTATATTSVDAVVSVTPMATPSTDTLTPTTSGCEASATTSSEVVTTSTANTTASDTVPVVALGIATATATTAVANAPQPAPVASEPVAIAPSVVPPTTDITPEFDPVNNDLGTISQLDPTQANHEQVVQPYQDSPENFTDLDQLGFDDFGTQTVVSNTPAVVDEFNIMDTPVTATPTSASMPMSTPDITSATTVTPETAVASTREQLLADLDQQVTSLDQGLADLSQTGDDLATIKARQQVTNPDLVAQDQDELHGIASEFLEERERARLADLEAQEAEREIRYPTPNLKPAPKTTDKNILLARAFATGDSLGKSGKKGKRVQDASIMQETRSLFDPEVAAKQEAYRREYEQQLKAQEAENQRQQQLLAQRQAAQAQEQQRLLEAQRQEQLRREQELKQRQHREAELLAAQRQAALIQEQERREAQVRAAQQRQLELQQQQEQERLIAQARAHELQQRLLQLQQRQEQLRQQQLQQQQAEAAHAAQAQAYAAALAAQQAPTALDGAVADEATQRVQQEQLARQQALQTQQQHQQELDARRKREMQLQREQAQARLFAQQQAQANQPTTRQAPPAQPQMSTPFTGVGMGQVRKGGGKVINPGMVRGGPASALNSADSVVTPNHANPQDLVNRVFHTNQPNPTEHTPTRPSRKIQTEQEVYLEGKYHQK